ncbi:heavy metal translocating P-type ATPase [Desulforegula conservatrix]|uniref:heavy metal translocating P-type ATPase n=1 Tax=Desulforegula conservatrix TaxID=153026 RepID=UPI00041ADEF1|nr:heavy metal translocating P-type ATPase [Desulforegula conservatrix]
MNIKTIKKQGCHDKRNACSTENEDRPSSSNCGAAGACCCQDHETMSGRDNNTFSAFYLEGLDCADCAASLENAINRIKGVSAKINFSSAKLKATYDKSITGPKEIIKVIAGFGYKATLEKKTDEEPVFLRTVFRLSGLDCADCAAKLEKRISAMPGVVAATVNFGAGKMTVEHSINDSDIRQEIKHAGYDAEQEKTDGLPDNNHRWWINAKTQATIVSGILLAIAVILNWAGVNGHITISLYILTAIIGGYHAAKNGFYGLKFLSLDMNVLMTIAIIGAMAIGEWSEGAVVAFLFSLGNALQTYTMDKTRHSIRLLMELAPPDALVRKYGTERRMPVKDIAKGDIIIVKPGERIAMDGLVHSGSSSVNQSTITGESIPVEKTEGDIVYAGTVNENGSLEIEVTRIASDSTLTKIMHLVEEAQAQRAPSQQFVDKFAKYYTPAVILAAAGVMILPWLFFKQPFDPWFYKGLVLLVISCPCALVISTPVSIVSAIGNASRQGVLIKGGAYLEQMGAIRAMAFDKTGTLTKGRPKVTDVVMLNNYSDTDFLSLAASIEKFSEHPLAQAILKKAEGLELRQMTNFKSLTGRGAQADIDGQTIFIGNTRLFEEIGHDLARYEATLANFELQGKTVMLVGTKDTVFGMIAAADIMRDNSIEAVRALRTAGMKHISMLTGDNPRVAGVIAEKLGLEKFYSSLLPEDKVAAVKKIAAEYGNVAMVGDGVNDAPALASATVGIAMGMTGSDMALETADIALMADDLHKLSYVVRLSRKTVAVIKQNIGFSVLVKFLFIVLTFLGTANLWLAVAADAGASILVTLNGMRLMKNLRQRSPIGNKT